MQDIEELIAAPARHFERASARTEAEREEHFQHWLAKYGQPYSDAVIAAGDQPWWTTVDERRELFMRRYCKPEPPSSVRFRTLAQVRGEVA